VIIEVWESCSEPTEQNMGTNHGIHKKLYHAGSTFTMRTSKRKVKIRWKIEDKGNIFSNKNGNGKFRY